ncbi:MAG: uroporphyrinogen decarboxylase family protein [Sellimonas sp.]|uniref:uroporphyrinogen decarboxylase family protein n=1 Tax=Sellimonas sp. TaxID=2021466 RepID=UPI0039A25F6D
MIRAEKYTADQMTPKERKQATEEKSSIDRLPVIPFIGEITGELTGTTTDEYWHDAKKMAMSEIAAFNRLGHDELSCGPNTIGISEGLGAEICYPKEGMPYFSGRFLTDYKMLDQMEPLRTDSERMKFFREAGEQIRDAADGIVDVCPSIGGPFTIAANLRGCEYFLRDCRKEPEMVHRLLRIVTDSMKNAIDMISGYADGFRMADPVASPALISPKYFREFAFPYLKELMEYGFQKIGQRPSLHICGNTYKVWGYFREMPIRAISLDNIMDLAKAKEELGHQMILMGNIDPVGIILQGTKSELQQEIRREAGIAKDSEKGYIMASGCDVPYQTDWKKLDIWMDEVRKLTL